MVNKSTSKNVSRWEEISKDQSKDAGMVVVLVLLLLGIFLRQKAFFPYAAAALLVDIILPVIYKPFAMVWFGLSTFLGTTVSKILLTIVYILLVLPVGLIRRLLGKDSLQLKKFKKNDSSVFRERNHLFESKDIENPY
jgi:hypothetical protein